MISQKLLENEERLKQVFENCNDIMFQIHRFGPHMKNFSLTIHCTTLVQDNESHIIKSAIQNLVPHEIGMAESVTIDDVTHFFNLKGISFKAFQLRETIDQIVEDIMSGHFIILFEHWDKAVSFDTLGVETRQVSEPASEEVVKGPREGTVEKLSTNIGLIRIRLQTPSFKIENFKAGEKSKKEIVFGYLDGTVNTEMLQEFKSRMKGIHQADILDTAYIEELIEDSTYSPFPQYRYTERPDVASAALMDGKIIVIVEGSGMIMICPGLFTDFFQSAEDYYQRFMFSSIIRLLRVFAFFIALTLPSFYIALSTFHVELIPNVLLIAIANSREGIPFPALIEALIMEFFFELLREAGIRLPRAVGSAVSIVGALIIGQAAIDSGLASPIMIVVVALTGIASFSIPQYSFAISMRILKIPFMILAATLGGFGLMIGSILLLLHLSSLRTLGQPYLQPVAPFRPKKMGEVFIRSPFKNYLNSSRKSKAGRASK